MTLLDRPVSTEGHSVSQPGSHLRGHMPEGALECWASSLGGLQSSENDSQIALVRLEFRGSYVPSNRKGFPCPSRPEVSFSPLTPLSH